MLNYLLKLSSDVESIYVEMSKTFSGFQDEFKFSCLSNCGKCCTKNGIEASMLEVLPLAVRILKSGEAELILEQIDEYDKSVQEGKKTGCFFYSEGVHCTVYNERATICRTFGAFVWRDRKNQKALSLCKLIKEQEDFKIDGNWQNGPEPSSWVRRIEGLDPSLGQKQYPLYIAVSLMLKKLLFYSTGFNDV